MTDSTSHSKPEDLVALLDLKALDVNHFRSSDVRLARGQRGAYGGQVISQAIVAATNTVDRMFHVHSLHCYFVMNGIPTPIDYHVDRIRSGRSYTTRVVRALQDGKTIFIMLCSFQKPEPWQPTYRSPMPDVPVPDQCETVQEYFRKCAEEQPRQWAKRIYLGRARFHDRSSIEVRRAVEGFRDGQFISCLWIRATALPECDTAYQKAVLGYISDLFFVETGSTALGLRSSDEEGADVSAFSTTIDHSIWYYSDDFDCSDWLMFESRVPQAGSGRAIIHRRAFTRDGTLIANFSQEGVVRARVFGPGGPSGAESKL